MSGFILYLMNTEKHVANIHCHFLIYKDLPQNKVAVCASWHAVTPFLEAASASKCTLTLFSSSYNVCWY